jgi:hypothetical protein
MVDKEKTELKGDSTKDEKIIEEALEYFEESQAGSDYNRNRYEADISFGRMGNQWPEDIKKQRQSESRPCLTINKIPAFVRQVVNDARQNKPGIIVSPVDNGADKATAEVINGLVRAIQRNSNADVAFDTALDHAVSGGFGFFRIGIHYASPESFDLEARIHRVPNPLLVHWDVNSTEFDASDWNYAFVSDYLSEAEFEQRWPDAEAVSFDGDTRGSVNEIQTSKDQVQIAEYFLREPVNRKLLELTNGMVIRESSLDDDARMLMLVEGVNIKRERMVQTHKVMRRVLSGNAVLEEDEWPGESIPICPVWGEEIIYDGERHFRSMIHDAKDPQMMFNFWRSASTELVALAPKAPWIGPKGFIHPDDAERWESANTRSYSTLEYDPSAGPAPQRQPFAGVPAGAIQEAMNSSDDMKSIVGIFDAGLGARSNETSGKAILARQKESDVSNFHFVDNLSRAIQYCGKCLVEIIPSVYTARSTLRIIGEDQKEKVVYMVNSNVDNQQAQQNQQVDEEAEVAEKLYDLSTGRYDVTVKAGPTYESQREETKETLIEIMRQVPGSAEFIGDILLKHMDFEGADEVAERFKMRGQPPQPPQQMPGGIPIDPNTGQPIQPQGQAPQGAIPQQ